MSPALWEENPSAGDWRTHKGGRVKRHKGGSAPLQFPDLSLARLPLEKQLPSSGVETPVASRREERSHCLFYYRPSGASAARIPAKKQATRSIFNSQGNALALSADALALQGIAKFNSLRVNQMLY
ncbi:MAG: hypothetical protein V7K48_12785 [Nostoc sp.]|uniref:hypothetical protein n=1 Tax=Nostoc sp. TaxID=1180 RepID=UPI002FFC02BE